MNTHPESLTTPDAALSLVLQDLNPLPAQETDASQAMGLVLAESVQADRDYPPFDRAVMDGYVVGPCQRGDQLAIVGEIAAGQQWPGDLLPGQTLAIMTGAPCPQGAERVIPREWVDESDPKTLTVPDLDGCSRYVVPQGSEARARSDILRTGDIITPLTAATLATVGVTRVKVHRAPRVTLIATGNELLPPGFAVGQQMIRDANTPLLMEKLRLLGIQERLGLQANDNPESLAQALTGAEDCDVLITIGGVSMGRYDLVPAALENWGAESVFHKVSQRPGKPLFFARRGRQLVFGLPGNPLSCHLCFHRYIRPALQILMGKPEHAQSGDGILNEAYQVKGDRTVFQLAKATLHDDQCELTPLQGQGSADLFAVHQANAMVRFEPNARLYPAGERIRFEWL